jgi:hypothetical protein
MDNQIGEAMIGLLSDMSGNNFQIIKTTALTGLNLKKIVILTDTVFTKLDSGSIDVFTLKNFEATVYPAGTIFPFNNFPITAVTLASGLAIGY